MSAAYCLGAALACCCAVSFFSSTARAPLRRRAARRAASADRADVVGSGASCALGRGRPFASPQPAAGSRAGPSRCPLAPTMRHPRTSSASTAIDAATAAALDRLGIHRYDAISRWSRGDLERIAQALGIRRQRMNRENWIEQAQMLASGGETHYARRRARGETASASPTADQGERRKLVAQPPPPPRRAPAAPTRRAAPSTAPGRLPPPRRAPPLRSARATPRRCLRPRLRRRRPTQGIRARSLRAGRPAGSKPPRRVASPAQLCHRGRRQRRRGPRPQPRRPRAPVAGDTPARSSPPSPFGRTPAAAADDLLRLRGIDAQAARRCRRPASAVTQQIATWSAADVASLRIASLQPVGASPARIGSSRRRS